MYEDKAVAEVILVRTDQSIRRSDLVSRQTHAVGVESDLW